ncbi:hypothetical protein DB30_08139 [Enhygromyxa salina]|uniref:DUF1109 domain-containing protein n=1 Tax=Enhygromyxa salina TaxID=215803 RepID=A0A0C2CZS6_9BACT|nr:DUF1109 family protein [Enhygromyxa salina]KIG13372.1 hypothetical protein DB30_08139 [Enhygromyxa salina]
MREPTPGPDELDAMFEAVERRIAAPVGWVEGLRQRSTWVRSAALLGVALAMVALILLGLRRVDLGLHPLPRLLGTIAALATAVLAAGAVALRPLHRRPLRGWLLGLIAGLAVLAPAIVCSLPPAHHDHPASLIGVDADLVPRAAGCFAFGMGFVALAVAAAYLLERSALRRRGSAVLALLGAGALANLVLVLHCPIVAPIHQWAGHATITLVLLLVAAGARARGA